MTKKCIPFLLVLLLAIKLQANNNIDTVAYKSGVMLMTNSFNNSELKAWAENHPNFVLNGNNAKENDYLGLDYSSQSKETLTKSSDDVANEFGFLTFVYRPYQLMQYMKIDKDEIMKTIEKRIKATDGYDYNGAYVLHIMQYDKDKGFVIETKVNWATFGQGNKGGNGLDDDDKNNIIKTTNDKLVFEFRNSVINELNAEGEASKKFVELLRNKDFFIQIEGYGARKFRNEETVIMCKKESEIKMIAYEKEGLSFPNLSTEWGIFGGIDKPKVFDTKKSELFFSLNNAAPTKKGLQITATAGTKKVIIYVLVVDIIFEELSPQFGYDGQDNDVAGNTYADFKDNPKNADKYPSHQTSPPINGLPWKSFEHGKEDCIDFIVLPQDAKDLIELKIGDETKFKITDQQSQMTTYQGQPNKTTYKHHVTIKSLVSGNYITDKSNESELKVKIGECDIKRVKLASYKSYTKKIAVIIIQEKSSNNFSLIKFLNSNPQSNISSQAVNTINTIYQSSVGKVEVDILGQEIIDYDKNGDKMLTFAINPTTNKIEAGEFTEIKTKSILRANNDNQYHAFFFLIEKTNTRCSSFLKT